MIVYENIRQTKTFNGFKIRNYNMKIKRNITKKQTTFKQKKAH